MNRNGGSNQQHQLMGSTTQEMEKHRYSQESSPYTTRGNTARYYQSPGPNRRNTPQRNDFFPPQNYQQWQHYPPPNYDSHLKNDIPLYNRYQTLADDEYYGNHSNPYTPTPFQGQRGRGGRGRGHPKRNPQVNNHKGGDTNTPLHYQHGDRPLEQKR